ncbi:hypothetical protein LX36DRAFT_649634 [Colletotrichum falcatum]|nr:hypothetical protein LX36DRAFT_649634 [Colletotrichum falcatum]
MSSPIPHSFPPYLAPGYLLPASFIPFFPLTTRARDPSSPSSPSSFFPPLFSPSLHFPTAFHLIPFFTLPPSLASLCAVPIFLS